MRYPLDIVAIPQNEIKNWQKNFFLPESPLKTWEMSQEIKEIYLDVVRKYSNTVIGDVLLINVKLYFEYLQVLVAVRYLQLLRKNNVIYSERSSIYKGIIETGVPSMNSVPYTTLNMVSTFQRLNRKAKQILRSIRNNKSLFYYLSSVKNGMRIVTLQQIDIEREYVAHLKSAVCNTSEVDWSFLPRPSRPLDHVNEEINHTCNEIIQKICEISAKYSIMLENNAVSFLMNITREHLVQTATDLFTIEKKLQLITPWHLLGGTQTGYFNRLIGLASIKVGGKLTGFNHGNDVARIRDYRMELSISNEFVSYSKESVKLINRCNKIFTPLNNNNCKITSIETDKYYGLWKDKRQNSIPVRIKKIMLVSSFYKIDGNLALGYNDLIYLDMEMRLIETLSKAGYTVLYKAHPGALNTQIDFNVFFGDGVVTIRKPFEEVIDRADAILFYYTGTTTFTWALCSNKPVILVDCEFGHRISDEAFELIKKRCRVISGGLDERNRFSFDEEELVEVLAKKPEEPNTEFIETYMFPEGVKS